MLLAGVTGLREFCKVLKVWTEHEVRVSNVSLEVVAETLRERNMVLLKHFCPDCDLSLFQPVEGAIPFHWSTSMDVLKLHTLDTMPPGCRAFFPFCDEPSGAQLAYPFNVSRLLNTSWFVAFRFAASLSVH